MQFAELMAYIAEVSVSGTSARRSLLQCTL